RSSSQAPRPKCISVLSAVGLCVMRMVDMTSAVFSSLPTQLILVSVVSSAVGKTTDSPSRTVASAAGRKLILTKNWLMGLQPFRITTFSTVCIAHRRGRPVLCLLISSFYLSISGFVDRCSESGSEQVIQVNGLDIVGRVLIPERTEAADRRAMPDG